MNDEELDPKLGGADERLPIPGAPRLMDATPAQLIAASAAYRRVGDKLLHKAVVAQAHLMLLADE